MPLNLLITAGSRRVPLVRAFQRALGQAAAGGAVIVADVNPLSPSVYVADRSYQVPLSTDPGYVRAVLDICRAERVGVLIPTIDDELTLFADHVEAFSAEGVRVVVSPPQTTEVCGDKYETCRLLNARGIAAAETFLPAALPAEPEFPLFIKPRHGRGGFLAFPVRNRRELAFFLEYVTEPVVQRYLDGPEFTIDMLCDFQGRPLSIVPRERVVIRAGVVDRGRTVRHPGLIRLGLQCAEAMRFVGAVNVQCRLVNGRPVVFEINPRFSGGIPLTIASGADFPRLIVDLALGRRVAPRIGAFQEELWMTSYEASVFVDAASIGFTPVPKPRAMEEVA